MTTLPLHPRAAWWQFERGAVYLTGARGVARGELVWARAPDGEQVAAVVIKAHGSADLEGRWTCVVARLGLLGQMSSEECEAWLMQWR